MIDAAEAIALDGASCSVFRGAPSWEGKRTAAVGRLAIADAAAGAALLNEVAERLAREGFGALVGPMDGDTWHAYRLVEDTDGSPPFLLEPRSGPHDLAAMTGAGFTPISRYVSARAALDAAIGTEAPPVPGIAVSSWDGRDADRLVDRLFEVSSAAFSRAAFFKPITREAFLALYRPVVPLIDPRLVLFAHGEDDGLAGFLFGLPDRLEGPRPSTVILKTYAGAQRGVGRLLADRFHRTSRNLGYSHVVHALMRDGNASLDRSARHGGAVFRRYALMGRGLGT